MYIKTSWFEIPHSNKEMFRLKFIILTSSAFIFEWNLTDPMDSPFFNWNETTQMSKLTFNPDFDDIAFGFIIRFCSLHAGRPLYLTQGTNNSIEDKSILTWFYQFLLSANSFSTWPSDKTLMAVIVKMCAGYFMSHFFKGYTGMMSGTHQLHSGVVLASMIYFVFRAKTNHLTTFHKVRSLFEKIY